MPIDYRTDKRYCHLTPEQVRRHFEEERFLAEKILQAKRLERTAVAVWAYDELFRRIPWHPALSEKSGQTAAEVIAGKVRTFLPLLPSPSARILEIGCGMGELSYGLMMKGFEVIGVDISDIRVKRLGLLKTSNLNFGRCDAVYLPFADQTFDAVISMQLFEHLHPEDAREHLQEVYRVLRPGGRYLLETPNRLTGPGDVSRFFTDGKAQGFHLKEYRITELYSLFSKLGYQKVKIVLRKKRVYSNEIARYLEKIWALLPRSLRLSHTLGMHNPIYMAFKPNT